MVMCPVCGKVIYTYSTDFGVQPKTCPACLSDLDNPMTISEVNNIFSYPKPSGQQCSFCGTYPCECVPCFDTGPSLPLNLTIASTPINPIKYEKTLVVNLLGGPGTGKSSLRGGLFSRLKFLGVDCEEAPEFAKDLTWEKRSAIDNQIYVFGKQHHRIWRLKNKVEVIITDSPLILTPIYDQRKSKTLSTLVMEEVNSMWNYNVFIKRIKDYNPNGRNQSEEEAIEIDRRILDFLDNHGLPYETFSGAENSIPIISNKILMLIGRPDSVPTRKQIVDALES